LRVERDLDALERSRRTLSEYLEARGVEPRALYRCELVFEELVANAIRHGVPGVAGPRPVDVGVAVSADAVELVFEDDDAPFDPTAAPEPPRPEAIDAAPIGGLGIAMVRRSALRLEYARRDGRNRVTLAIARG
jgi:anti-sigma regulatory factor (Ser/Thr protein kinase)